MLDRRTLNLLLLFLAGTVVSAFFVPCLEARSGGKTPKNVQPSLYLTALQSSVIYVDDDNVAGPWDGTEQHPYANIASANLNALAGDTIFVHNGTYNENIVVTKRLALLGENKDAAVINGSYLYMVSVVSITANDVWISGFSIQNGWCGVSISSCSGCNIIGNRIINNNYRGGAPGQVYKTGRGVMLNQATNATVAENLIEGNDRNISLEHTENSTVENNTVLRAASSWGIILEGSNSTTIRKNTVKYSAYEGIYLAGAHNNTIANNFVISNGDEGIYLGSSHDNIIKGNVVTNNPGDGIMLDWSNWTTVSENMVASNGKRGILASYSQNATICHNWLLVNSWGEAYSNLPNMWDSGYPSGGNHWSDYPGTDFYSGIYQNETGSDGIGDTPYPIQEGNIDRYPLVIVQGDLNGDRNVDIFDAITLSAAYGSTPETPNWNPNADINIDNTVDIYDALILANNYGKTT